MKYEDIKPFVNINDALSCYNKVTKGQAVKFVKPSNSCDWMYTCCKTLLVVKFLKTIEQNLNSISWSHHIKYDLKLFWDSKTVQIKEDRSNYTIIITQGAGHIPTKSRALYSIYHDLFCEMHRSLPREKLDYNMKYIELYSSTIDGK